MHRLHGYLVSLRQAADDALLEIGRVDRETLARFLVSYTVHKTKHLETVFDSRNFDAMGIWADTHPDPVVFASDDPDRFKAELTRIMLHQKKVVEDCIGALLDRFSDDCSLYCLPYCLETKENDAMAHNLLEMAKTLYGEYHIESGFYDTTRMTAKLPQERVEEIMQNPDDFALVFIPLHR